MSGKFRPTDELETLSLLLDELNAGRQPDCDDPETAELLAVAAFLKQEAGPVCPPQQILDQTVDRALAGLKAAKPHRARIWWFSGTVGVAAAAILVIGLNLLPSWQQQVAVVPPPAAVSVQPAPLQATPANDNTPTGSPAAAAVPAEEAKPTDTAAAVERQAPANGQEKAKPAAVQAPPELLQPPVESRYMAKSAYATLTPLRIPGQVPDLMVVDRENGVLRQIFFKGTPQEVTVVQQLRPRSSGGTQDRPLRAAKVAVSADKPDHVNTVRVTVADQEVTLEGSQSRQELLKLADSLTQ